MGQLGPEVPPWRKSRAASLAWSRVQFRELTRKYPPAAVAAAFWD